MTVTAADSLRDVPPERDARLTTLYRLFDAHDRLLYIGIGNPGRFLAHRRDKGWWPDVARATFEHYPTRPDALAAETAAIKRERPLHNVVHNLAAELRTDDAPSRQANPPRDQRFAYSPGELAEALGCTRVHVQNMIARGELRSIKLGRRRLIPRVVVDELLAGEAEQ